jgi:hypothetical protein
MKKLIILLIVTMFVTISNQAQTMTVPDPNTPNTLFLKFSHTLNSPHAYITDVNISEYPETRDYKPIYSFISGGVMNASLSIIRNWFYAIDPEECAYIDPALYNSVSLSREQLVNILKTKTVAETKTYLDSFTTIYLIDYEQKYAKNNSKVKILKVRPFYNFFR